MRIAIDTETTGLGSQKGRFDEILSLSIVEDGGNILYEKYFKPDVLTEWKEAEAINGISPSMVFGCPSIKEEREHIQSIIDSADEILIYNAPFDTEFMENVGIHVPESKIIDTMIEYANQFEDSKWKSLVKATEYLGCEWQSAAHNASADATMTLAVQKIIDECKENNMTIHEYHDNLTDEKSADEKSEMAL